MVVDRDRDPGTVTWRDAGWDVGPEPEDDPPIRFLGGPFTFDRAQHDAVLAEFVRTFDAVRAALPIDPAAPAPRRRRWWRPGPR
jgi:hypothetical protein